MPTKGCRFLGRSLKRDARAVERSPGACFPGVCPTGGRATERRRLRTRRSLRRLFLISFCLVALMASAAALAIEGHLRSEARYRQALAARADVARVQRASILLWQEREAINEYFVSPSAPILAEIRAQHRAFDTTLSEADSNIEAGEDSLELSAQTANDALLATFEKDLTTSDRITIANILTLDRLALNVVGRVDARSPQPGQRANESTASIECCQKRPCRHDRRSPASALAAGDLHRLRRPACS